MSGSRLSSKKRQEQIMDVALNIIYEEGYYNLTIRNIANEIDISEAAIYRHFKNKEEIINKLSTRVFKKNNLVSKDLSDDNPFNILKNIFYKQIEVLEKEPYLTAILFQEEIFREYPDIRNKFKKHRRKNEKFIVNLIKKGKDKGYFRKDVDEESFALLFMGSLRLLILKWREANFSYSPKAEMDNIFEELSKLLKTD